MKWWCISCCEPEVPDIDVNMSCPSACCNTNTNSDENTTHSVSNQAKLHKPKRRKYVKKRRRRQKEETE